VFECSRELGRECDVAVAEEPARVFDQEQVASQWETLEHPFAARIEPAAVFNRAKRDSSRLADAFDLAALPCSAAFESPVR
jgi:hypothetical protein